MHIQEIHPLVIGDLYQKYDGFLNITATELCGLLSCFTNISMPNDLRLSIPGDTHINGSVKNIAKHISSLMDKYYDLESEYQLDTGAEYNYHFELIDYIINWCKADNEINAKLKVFIGYFLF